MRRSVNFHVRGTGLRLLQCQLVHPSFHARFKYATPQWLSLTPPSAVQREYRYHIATCAGEPNDRPLFLRDRCWFINHMLDVDAMRVWLRW